MSFRPSRKLLRLKALITCLLLAVFGLTAPTGGLLVWVFVSTVSANTTAQTLPFSQNWTNTGLITADNNWDSVPGIIGYLGDGLTATTAVDPQTVVGDGSGTQVDVNANRNDPDTFVTGGVAEFDGIANPVVALNGSGTADAPHIVITLNTTGKTGITVSYNLRDIDGSADNAVQPVALQYRVGNSGNYTNIAAGFVADASSGPSLATLVTPVSAALPGACENQVLIQLRIITTNAVGNDEWIGIDDISVTASSTAASGVVSGRISDRNGAPVPGTVVRLSGTQSRVTITDASGNYRFEDVETGGFYAVTPERANYVFSPANRTFSQLGNHTEAKFTASSTGDKVIPPKRNKGTSMPKNQPQSLQRWMILSDLCGCF